MTCKIFVGCTSPTLACPQTLSSYWRDINTRLHIIIIIMFFFCTCSWFDNVGISYTWTLFHYLKRRVQTQSATPMWSLQSIWWACIMWSCDCHVINIVIMVTGHSMKECTGEVRVKQGEVSTCIYSKFLFSCMYVCMYYMCIVWLVRMKCF